MIHGIGTDIVEVARVERALARHGARFVRRVLGAGEMDAFRGSPRPAAFLARRFAAKEAAAKAIGTGIGAPFSFPAIQVRRAPGEAPELIFDGAARRALDERGAGRALLTLSDEREYAVAFVILLTA